MNKHSFIILMCAFICTHSHCQNNLIWSSHTHDVDYVGNPETCSEIRYDEIGNHTNDEGQPLSATILSDGDQVHLYALEPADSNTSYLWKVKYLDALSDTIVESFPTNDFYFDFIKHSTEGMQLFDQYWIELYQDEGDTIVLKDTDQYYIVDAKKGANGGFMYGFDSGDIRNWEGDEDGHLKITKYPDFCSNGNSRSDLGALKQKLYDKCLFNAYYSDSTLGANESAGRSGDGCIHIFNPPKDQNTAIDYNLLDINCPDYDKVTTYDFLNDPCGFDAISTPVENHGSYKQSITANSQLNIYPNHTIGDEFFYGFSIKIPEDFDESRLVDQSGARGKDRWQVLADFHQATWPFDTDMFPHACQASLQLLYLGDGKIGINFGLKHMNRACFGPYEIEKGEWFDVIFHLTWGQIKEKTVDTWTGHDGCLQFFLNTGDGYEKQCLVPATNFWRDYRTIGSKSKNQEPFDVSADHKTLFGPNLENFNPPYLSLKTMRGAALGGTQGFDFRTDVFFDELRIAASLQEVALPGVSFVPDSLLDCQPLLDVAIKSQKLVDAMEKSWSYTVAPNPVDHRGIQLHFEGVESDESFLVKIYHSDGRLVHEENLQLNGLKKEISTTGWNTGLYFIQIHSELRKEREGHMVFVE